MLKTGKIVDKHRQNRNTRYTVAYAVHRHWRNKMIYEMLGQEHD